MRQKFTEETDVPLPRSVAGSAGTGWFRTPSWLRAALSGLGRRQGADAHAPKADRQAADRLVAQMLDRMGRVARREEPGLDRLPELVAAIRMRAPATSMLSDALDFHIWQILSEVDLPRRQRRAISEMLFEMNDPDLFDDEDEATPGPAAPMVEADPDFVRRVEAVIRDDRSVDVSGLTQEDVFLRVVSLFPLFGRPGSRVRTQSGSVLYLIALCEIASVHFDLEPQRFLALAKAAAKGFGIADEDADIKALLRRRPKDYAVLRKLAAKDVAALLELLPPAPAEPA